ncbi:MAG: YodL domain-containing protein [Lachnospiraceae bacterium]|nr:YodL domain-containing protein [Lachnospiraceae bacterium]
MKNDFPDRELAEERQKKYKPGTVVILERMNDEHAPEIGSMGEVISVDDIGTVHVSWLTGRVLGAVYGEDVIHLATPHEAALYRINKESKRQKANPDAPCFCPRCGEEMDGIARHALSRRAAIIICDECGVKESIEDAVAAGAIKGEKALPIEEWAVVKGAYHIRAEEVEKGWKVSIPETRATSYCDSLSDIVPTGVKLRTGKQTITYEIYQLKQTEANHKVAFMPLSFLQEKGITVDRERYEMVYNGTVETSLNEELLDSTDCINNIDLLNQLYLKFNTSQPADFKGHSLSISDVVVINKGGITTAFYVDKIGFTECQSEFFK